jgi:hypothetical protein
LLALSPALACAATNDTKLHSPSSPGTDQPNSAIKKQSESSDLRLGKGDWVVRGPVVDSLSRRPTENRSLGRRILGFPIVRLFVPKPTPPSSETEVYFVEGESSRPWAAIASDARRIGSPENPRHLEGGCALISIGR